MFKTITSTNKLKNTLNIKPLILFCLSFLLFLKPEISATLNAFALPSISMKKDLFILGVAALIIFALLIRHFIQQKKIDAFFIFFLVYVGFIGLASFMNPGNNFLGMFSRGHDLFKPAYFGWNIDWTPIACTVFLLAIYGKKYPREIMWAMALVSSLYMIINLFFVIKIAIAINFQTADDSFLYHRNILFRMIIPAFACSLWVAWQKRGAWFAWPTLIFLVCAAQVYLAYSATCTCVLVVVGILGIVMTFKRPRSVLNGLTYGCAYAATFFGFVLFRVQLLFGFLIEAILHKSATFTGRTLVWDGALNALQGWHLIFGYGPVYLWNMLRDEWQAVRHAHNEVLNTLMLGGLCALAGLVGCAVLSIQKLYQFRTTNAAAAIALGLAGFFTAAIAEPVTFPAFFFMLAAGYYVVPTLAQLETEHE